MRRWLARIAIAIAALLVAVAVLGFGFVRSYQRSLPIYDGTVTVAGLAAPVAIDRDRYAIPHIRGGSFDDAAFGLGYAHAQDRLWQMEISRRYVEGRLAELFGAPAIPADAMMRAMGLYAAAEEAVKHLSPETQQLLKSYSAGVNAFLVGHNGPLPIEFTLAGDTPEPWQAADSIAVLKGMAMMLSENAFGEAARVKLLASLGRTGVQDFFPPFAQAPLPDYLDMLFGGTRVGDAYGIPDTTASDNWAVDGAHSETGKPLLANDPHLGFSIPSTWYLAHLAIPGDDLVGGTLAGIPAIIVGHNRHVAWGLTNTGPDTQDLYLERINPDNSGEYQVPGGWAAFESHSETIKVRFGAERRILVRATRHGPVMDDGPGSPFAGVAPKGYVLALAWTALAPDDTTMDAVFGMNRAADARAFTAATRAFVTPMQNIVFADEAGHIGLVLPGRVPLRAKQNDSRGLVPAEGWDARYDWQGYIPVDKAPLILDPPSGRIVTANNKTVPDKYPYTLTYEWEPPYRHDRIDALLTGRMLRSPSDPTKVLIDAHSQATGLVAATSQQSIDSFRAIQLDTVDTYALALKSRLTAAGPFPASDAPAAELMDGWNGAMAGDRPEPLIFAAWSRALARRIFADELGPNFSRYWSYLPEFTLRVLDNVEGEARWCDDKTTQTIEDCATRIRLALHDAVAELGAAYGAAPSHWRWDDAHKATFANQPFGALPMIGPLFNREIAMDGGPFTPLRADNNMASRRPYAAIHGAGYRGIYDLADEDRSLYIISTGQSGNPYSLHYDDLMPLWAKGDYIAVHTQPAAIANEAVDHLDLQPMSGVKLP